MTINLATPVGITYMPRGPAEVAGFARGLDLVGPGVIPMLAWHPDGSETTDQHGGQLRADGTQTLIDRSRTADELPGADGDSTCGSASRRLRRATPRH